MIFSKDLFYILADSQKPIQAQDPPAVRRQRHGCRDETLH